MSHTHRSPKHKFDDEQTSGRRVKRSHHSNNKLYGTIPTILIVDEIENADFYKNIFEKLDNDVESSINKQ